MNDEQLASVCDALMALVGTGAHARIHGYCTVADRYEHDPLTFPDGCCCRAEGIACFGDTGVRLHARTLAADQLAGILALARRHRLGLRLAAAAGGVDVRLEPPRAGAARPGKEQPARREASPNGTPLPTPAAPAEMAVTADAARRALQDAQNAVRDRRTLVLHREQRDWIWCAAHTLSDYATGTLTAEDDDRRGTLMCAAELHEVVRAFDAAAPRRADRRRG